MPSLRKGKREAGYVSKLYTLQDSVQTRFRTWKNKANNLPNERQSFVNQIQELSNEVTSMKKWRVWYL